MKSLQNFFQYAYLAIAAFFGYQAVMEFTNKGTKGVFFILLAVAAVGMFFFKRHFNKKIQNSKNNK